MTDQEASIVERKRLSKIYGPTPANYKRESATAYLRKPNQLPTKRVPSSAVAVEEAALIYLEATNARGAP